MKKIDSREYHIIQNSDECVIIIRNFLIVFLSELNQKDMDPTRQQHTVHYCWRALHDILMAMLESYFGHAMGLLPDT